MEKEDVRKLTAEAQEQLRKQAIRLWKQGKKYTDIAQVVGAHRDSVSRWCKAYAKDGASLCQGWSQWPGLKETRHSEGSK
jgi:transposase